VVARHPPGPQNIIVRRPTTRIETEPGPNRAKALAAPLPGRARGRASLDRGVGRRGALRVNLMARSSLQVTGVQLRDEQLSDRMGKAGRAKVLGGIAADDRVPGSLIVKNFFIIVSDLASSATTACRSTVRRSAKRARQADRGTIETIPCPRCGRASLCGTRSWEAGDRLSERTQDRPASWGLARDPGLRASRGAGASSQRL